MNYTQPPKSRDNNASLTNYLRFLWVFIILIFVLGVFYYFKLGVVIDEHLSSCHCPAPPPLILDYFAYTLPCLGGVLVGGGLFKTADEKKYVYSSIVCLVGGMEAFALMHIYETRYPAVFLLLCLMISFITAFIISVRSKNIDGLHSWEQFSLPIIFAIIYASLFSMIVVSILIVSA